MNEPHLTHLAICCQIYGVRLAVAKNLVLRVSSGRCLPPPTWAQTWIGGLCWMDEELLVVVDPSGVMSGHPSSAPHHPLLVMVDPTAYLPRWALAVESALDNVLIERQESWFVRPSTWPCPQEWLQSACDSQGRPLAWLDVSRVAENLASGYQALAVR